MPYTNMWELSDDNGTVHSGTEDEMKLAFDVMTESEQMNINYYGKKEAKKLMEKYCTEWHGDLRLIQIHDARR